jgi:hypothetical protein
LKGVSEVGVYDEKFWKSWGVGRGVQFCMMNDVYESAPDPNDGSREFLKVKSEKFTNCSLKDALEVRDGGEAAVLEQIEDSWVSLREKMKAEDGTGEREFLFR